MKKRQGAILTTALAAVLAAAALSGCAVSGGAAGNQAAAGTGRTNPLSSEGKGAGYLKQMGKTAKIIEVNGAVEITPSLGLSDVIVDITSSGSTLKQNRLRIIDKIMDSSCVIVQRKDLSDEIKKQISALLTAINAVMDAKEKKYLMVNLPKTKLEELKTFLPGLSSPTVMTLWGDDKNVAVHVVVDKDKIYDSINHLKAIGGEGILILTVDQMVR